MGSSLNQRTAEFSLCNTLVLLLDLAFKQLARKPSKLSPFRYFGRPFHEYCQAI